jgi:hypothetical protein
MKAKHETREEWLNAAADLLRPMFKARAKVDLPKNIRLSCGWTSKGQRSKAVAECWSPNNSADKTIEVFISPKRAEPLDVLGDAVHELVHAGVGLKAKHGPIFKAAAHAMGLEGPMKSTEWSDAGKVDISTPLLAKLGPYPHAMLTGRSSLGPKQPTRLLKVWCPSCEYTARITKKWLDVGVPLCPNGDCEAFGDEMQHDPK